MWQGTEQGSCGMSGSLRKKAKKSQRSRKERGTHKLLAGQSSSKLCWPQSWTEPDLELGGRLAITWPILFSFQRVKSSSCERWWLSRSNTERWHQNWKSGHVAPGPVLAPLAHACLPSPPGDASPSNTAWSIPASPPYFSWSPGLGGLKKIGRYN